MSDCAVTTGAPPVLEHTHSLPDTRSQIRYLLLQLRLLGGAYTIRPIVQAAHRGHRERLRAGQRVVGAVGLGDLARRRLHPRSLPAPQRNGEVHREREAVSLGASDTPTIAAVTSITSNSVFREMGVEGRVFTRTPSFLPP